MSINMSPKELAEVIATAARATLEQVFASGCTSQDVADIAQALANNAAQVIVMLEDTSE